MSIKLQKEPQKTAQIAPVQITEYRSVKIRKDVFELLKLYCLCHRQSPRDVVSGILESRLEGFKGHIDEIRRLQ